MNNDIYKIKRTDVIQKFLLGYTVGKISGDTGVPKIRIEREMEYELRRNPAFVERRAQSMYAKRKRWAGAVLVMEPRERYHQ